MPNSHCGIGERSRNNVLIRLWDMPRTELSVTHVRILGAHGVEVQLPHFCVFDGSFRIVIEAQNGEDAHYLCSEMGWEFICACDD